MFPCYPIPVRTLLPVPAPSRAYSSTLHPFLLPFHENDRALLCSYLGRCLSLPELPGQMTAELEYLPQKHRSVDERWSTPLATRGKAPVRWRRASGQGHWERPSSASVRFGD